MNREIKFRVWDKDANKWVVGLMYCIDNISRVKKEWHILMQFTGLTDKNGVEIYEGDIIKMGDNPECWFAPRVVEFKNGSWMGGTCRIYTNQDYKNYEGDANQDNWEVIGNIYENPELLNQKN